MTANDDGAAEQIRRDWLAEALTAHGMCAAGKTMELHAGDVVVIPAGVAHKNEGASPDLLVVGAYPRGQSPDMCRPGAADHARALPRVAAVPLPAGDPVHGPSGPLLERWRSVQRG